MSFTISETTVEIPANSNGVGSSQTDSRHMKTFKKHSSIIDAFLYNYEQLKAHKHGHATELDGHTLAIADVIAIARFGGSVRLNTSKEVKGRVEQSRAVIDNMLRSHISIYGVSTGFGGSGSCG
ncbi:hypothetical protein FRB91_009454 [Serendipita sp. 411]|nr:hypothetical protein FRB91_009454 [Serendipita sp. 411]